MYRHFHSLSHNHYYLSICTKDNLVLSLYIHTQSSQYIVVSVSEYTQTHKKVGGILCESKIKDGIVDSFIIGIGININESLVDFPGH